MKGVYYVWIGYREVEYNLMNKIRLSQYIWGGGDTRIGFLM